MVIGLGTSGKSKNIAEIAAEMRARERDKQSKELLPKGSLIQNKVCFLVPAMRKALPLTFWDRFLSQLSVLQQGAVNPQQLNLSRPPLLFLRRFLRISGTKLFFLEPKVPAVWT